MEKENALRLIESSSRREHSLLVSKIMTVLSDAHGESNLNWELAGLLHDLDYDATIDERGLHGEKAAEALTGLVDESVLHAIKSHDHRAGYKPSSLLDNSLQFADAVSILLRESEDVLDEKPWVKEIIEEYQLPNGLGLPELIRMFSESL